MRIVFYSPFPDIKSKNDYLDFVTLVKMLKRDPTTGLPLGYDELGDYSGHASYRTHVDELNGFKPKHIKMFEEKYKKKSKNAETNEPFKIDNKFYPKSKKEASTYLSEYNIDDRLFIHAHGNSKVIGTGSFVLDPALLAKNLQLLGLDPVSPPVIYVWACNSGAASENDIDSYADKTRDELKKLGYQNVIVIGVDASIIISNGKDPVSYAQDKLTRSGQLQKASIPENKAAKAAATPEAKKGAGLTGNEGMLTLGEKIAFFNKNKSRLPEGKIPSFNLGNTETKGNNSKKNNNDKQDISTKKNTSTKKEYSEKENSAKRSSDSKKTKGR